jgi:polysaccharide export outer membrane protein
MNFKTAGPHVCFVLAFSLLAGCSSTTGIGSGGPLIREVTPEGKKAVVLDQTMVPTKELHKLPESPGVISPENPVTGPAGPTPEGQEAAAAASPTPDGGIPVAPAVAEEPEYRIQPGDVLEFQSLDDEMLNRPNIVVRYDGYVSLPLVPDIKLADKSRQEALDLVRTAYKPFFKDTPQVSLSVVTANSRSFNVAGAVQQPGEFQYSKPISVLAAINKAGGIRTTGSRNEQYVSQQGQLVKAFIIRHTADRRDVYSVNLQGITMPGPHPSETPVLPGDIVFVPEGLNLIYVLGEVRRPDVYHWTEGLTLLQLLAAVGGPTFVTGRMSEVALMRQVDDQNTKVLLLNVKQMLKTGQTITMQPGDVVYIPRKKLVRAQEFVGRISGTVSPILNLYTQAYDAYYTKDRFNRILDKNSSNGATLGVLQGLRDFTSAVNSVAPLVTPANP